MRYRPAARRTDLMELSRMLDLSVRSETSRPGPEVADRVPRVIAPHVPVARDLVALYAARVASTGADVLPALRNRRASFPTTSEPVIGYLAASMPKLGCPIPVGRGTATHRQALGALAASKWATQPGWLPEPEPVRVTRAGGGIGRARPVVTESAYRPGLKDRLSAALAAFSRPVTEPQPEAYGQEPGRRLEARLA